MSKLIKQLIQGIYIIPFPLFGHRRKSATRYSLIYRRYIHIGPGSCARSYFLLPCTFVLYVYLLVYCMSYMHHSLSTLFLSNSVIFYRTAVHSLGIVFTMPCSTIQGPIPQCSPHRGEDPPAHPLVVPLALLQRAAARARQRAAARRVQRQRVALQDRPAPDVIRYTLNIRKDSGIGGAYEQQCTYIG